MPVLQCPFPGQVLMEHLSPYQAGAESHAVRGTQALHWILTAVLKALLLPHFPDREAEAHRGSQLAAQEPDTSGRHRALPLTHPGWSGPWNFPLSSDEGRPAWGRQGVGRAPTESSAHSGLGPAASQGQERVETQLPRYWLGGCRPLEGSSEGGSRQRHHPWCQGLGQVGWTPCCSSTLWLSLPGNACVSEPHPRSFPGGFILHPLTFMGRVRRPWFYFCSSPGRTLLSAEPGLHCRKQPPSRLGKGRLSQEQMQARALLVWKKIPGVETALVASVEKTQAETWHLGWKLTMRREKLLLPSPHF